MNRNNISTMIAILLIFVAWGTCRSEDWEEVPCIGAWRLVRMDADESLWPHQRHSDLVVAVVDCEGIVSEAWHGRVSAGERIAPAERIPKDGKTWKELTREGNLPSDIDKILQAPRRVVVVRRNHGDGSFDWACDGWIGSVFWLVEEQVYAVFSTNSHKIASLPRLITWAGGFDLGPRMTPQQLKSRLIEFAVRADRQLTHYNEIMDAQTADEYLPAIAAYRCEYGETPPSLGKTLPWTDKTGALVTAVSLSPNFRDAKALLAIECLQSNRDVLKEIVAQELPSVLPLESYETHDLPRSCDWDSEMALLADDADNLGGIVKEYKMPLSPEELGWWKIRGRLGDHTVDRIALAKTLRLHKELYGDEAPEAHRETIAEWAELLADDGPLAKKLDKDIPFAQKILGYCAGTYVMKFRRPKDAAPVEPEKPAKPATKPDESRAVEPSPAHAGIAPPPSRWPSFAMAVACLAIGAVLGRWSGR